MDAMFVSIHHFNDFYNKCINNKMGMECLCLLIKIFIDSNESTYRNFRKS